jgi:hypothetical protein
MLTATLAVVDIGRAGAWVGPLIVGALAGGLDYSAAGSAALRDRVAVPGYYAAAVSFCFLLGLAQWEQATITDYNWRMIWGTVSVVTHGCLLVCWFGRPARLAKALGKITKFAGTDSSAAKINQTLLGWTVAAAVTAPMSGDGGWGSIVATIAQATTGIWSSAVTLYFHWIGG